MSLKPILIHTHFHKRKTGVTRSIENVLPFFNSFYETFIYGYNVKGVKISFSKLRKLLFSNREVIVHCHRNNEILRFLIFRLFGAKFKLISTRHAETKSSGLTKYLLKQSDKIITLTESMSVNLGIENTCVGHGVDVTVFVPDSEAELINIRQEHVILCAGRVRKSKGQKVLLEAALPVLKKNKEWALVIVGKVDKPAFLEELKELAKKHKVEKQVYFINETPNIISYYQAAKIAVSPSFSEGFSLVCAEAMACECTTIATKNVGVHSNLISNKKNGYLFEMGNSKELGEILESIIEKKLSYLGEEAREEIIKNWSAEKEANSLMQVYSSF